MKLTKYIAIGVLALGLASCDDKSDLGVMQVNPQTPVLTPGGTLSVTATTPLSGGNITLSDYQGGSVPAVQYAFVDSVMDNATPVIVMQLASKEDYSDAIDITLENAADGNTCSVSTQAWDDAFRRLLGKAPSAKPNYVRFAAYLTNGTQLLRVGDDNTWFAPTTVTVTPIDLGIRVEEAYYLVGSVNGWNLATAIKFDHSDKSVYDDPVFTLSINVTAEQAKEGWWWKIVPESNFKAQEWNGLYGPEMNGDPALSGNLYAGGEAGALSTAGQQLFTIDMLSCTYSVTNALKQLYTPGQSNGWAPAESSTLTTNDFTNYNGFLYLNGEWLMTPAPDWDNGKWGLGASAGTLVAEGANIPCPAEGAGLYWTTANIGSLTYSTSPITSISLIGDFNGWGGDVDLTPSEDMLTWTGTITFENAGGWKFRCNHDWAVSLGGDINDLTTDNGSNINAEPGTYKVTLSLKNHPYTATLTKE